MPLNVYLIRLLVSFVFGLSSVVIMFLIYAALSYDWYVGERVWLTILSHLISIIIFLGSGYLLRIIK